MPEPAKSAPAPKKGSKKAITKTQKKGDKKRKKSRELLHLRHKVLKQSPPTRHLLKAMSINRNSFVYDIFERHRGRASRLAHYTSRSTHTCSARSDGRAPPPRWRAGQKHAVLRGPKAVHKYTSSK
uniref:Uncharacterized protein n=1 Tax=Laticauda laticaudata TaxID=8630 RepID=A0A8C5WZB9_LATLA